MQDSGKKKRVKKNSYKDINEREDSPDDPELNLQELKNSSSKNLNLIHEFTNLPELWMDDSNHYLKSQKEPKWNVISNLNNQCMFPWIDEKDEDQEEEWYNYKYQTSLLNNQ